MNRIEAVELVQVLEQEEVDKLIRKEKEKTDVEDQFSLKKTVLRELSGKIQVGF